MSKQNLITLTSQNNYRSPFSRWNESSWIRSKPIRENKISGLPFSPDLVPASAHQSVANDFNCWMTVLAYRLLAHLQFTTRLELNHVNPICSSLAQGQAPIVLTTEQSHDALRIYCDEGGHALFVELLSKQVEQTFGVDSKVLGCPQFERTLEQVIEEYQTQVAPNLIKLFFVTVSETLVTKVLHSVPQDQRVAPAVRAVIGDHAADEALHSAYFRNLFPILWHGLSLREREIIGQLLPRLIWAFLGPDYSVEANVLEHLGFAPSDVVRILEEVYVPTQVAQAVRQAAKPTIKMFETAGVFANSVVKQVFADYELI